MINHLICASCHIDTFMLPSWGNLIEHKDIYGNIQYWHKLCLKIYKDYYKIK